MMRLALIVVYEMESMIIKNIMLNLKKQKFSLLNYI